jgi:hypothetical protein
LIAEEIPEPGKGGTCPWLAEMKAGAGPGNAALAKKHVQCHQEIQVKVLKAHIATIESYDTMNFLHQYVTLIQSISQIHFSGILFTQQHILKSRRRLSSQIIVAVGWLSRRRLVDALGKIVTLIG